MLYAILVLILLGALYFISRYVKREVYRFLIKLFVSKKIVNYSYSFLFFPGTLFHEMSHVLSAVVLLVPVKRISLFPRVSDRKIIMGSVTLQKVDVIRETLVGLSPFIFGVVSLLILAGEVIKQQASGNYFLLILLLYFIFQISNSMFLSKSDLITAMQLSLVLVIGFLIIFIIGIRFDLDIQITIPVEFVDIVKKSSVLLLIPLMIDSAILLLVKLFDK